MRRPQMRVVFTLAAAAGFLPGLVAQSSPAPIDPALRARFGFVGPKIQKVGEGIEYLRVVDRDRDGRAEICLHDPAHAHVVRLALAADGSVERSTIDTRGSLRGLAVGDVRGEGPAVVIALRADGRLVVDLGAERPLEVEVGPPRGGDALRIADLDGDGVPDVVVYTRDGIRCVLGLNGTPRVTAAVDPGELPVADFEVTDADGDGTSDLVVGASIDELPLRVARGDGRGGFGPWLAFGNERLSGLFVGPRVEGRPTLAMLVGTRRRLVLSELTRGGGLDAAQLTVVPSTKRAAIPFAQGDFDGDGDLDLALAQPERAELHLLLEDGGRFHVVAVPSFVGISSLAAGDVDGDGKTDLVLASPDEKALAWRSGAVDLNQFPERIDAGAGEPVSVGIARDGTIHCIVRDRSKNGTLVTIARVGDSFGEPVTACKLGRVASEPLRLVVGEFDATAGDDVAYVAPGEGLRVARGKPGGGYHDVDPKADEGAAFAQRIEDGAFGVFEATSGGATMLVLRDRFARAFRLDAAGQPDVSEQRNVPAGADAFDVGGMVNDGILAAVERKANRLHYVSPDGSARSVALPPIMPTHVLAHGHDVVVIGRGGVVRVRRGESWQVRELASKDPPTDDSRYYGGVAADLDADGVGDLAVLDSDLHGVQLHVGGGAKLERGVAFPVFERSGADSDLREPREISAGDLDGDGRDDLVLIAFDRVLIYLQEKPDSDR